MGGHSQEPHRAGQTQGAVDFEILINELAADQAAMRVVLQSFLLRLFAVRRETAPTALAELREHVLKSVAAIPVAPNDLEGGGRWKKLVGERAELLFAEIGDAMDLPLRNAGPPN